MKKQSETSDAAIAVHARLADVPIDWKSILKNSLASIGWTLRPIGCDHYIFVSHAGIETNIEFWNDRLEIKNHTVFGHSSDYESYVDFGYITIYLSDVEIKMKPKDNRVSFVGKTDKGIFMTIRRIDDRYRKEA